MQWRLAVRAWGASRQYLSRPVCTLAIAALAASAAGCSSVPSNGRLSLASAVAPGSTIAFESIDGPPQDVFGKLVTNLNDEAGKQQVAVVSRSAAPTYRVRGYVSALVDRNKTTFAWVWDVYDSDKRRVLRINGEQPAAEGKRRDAWAAADEQVLRRMAKSGMERIATFLNSPEASPPAAAPEPNFVTLVSGRDDTPEGAGIVRATDQPDGQPEAVPDALPPHPQKGKKRPATAARQAATLARVTDGRSSGQ